MALVHKHMDHPSRSLRPETIPNYNNENILDKNKNHLEFRALKKFLSEWTHERSNEEKENVQQISEKEFEDLKERLILDNPLGKWTQDTDKDGKNIYLRIYPVLGEYDPEKKKIILYMENIKKCLKAGIDVEKSDLFNIILLHEMFHAYFHYVTERGKCSYNYILEIEEAMTEFCSLVCLKDLSVKDNWGDVFDYAKENIEEKQDEVGKLAAYGFGAYLFDNLKENERYELINNYIQKLGYIDEDNDTVKEYCQKVRLSKYVPNRDNQKDCMELLIKILDPNNDVMTPKKHAAKQQPEEKSLPQGTTQIKIFSGLTYDQSRVDALTIDHFEQIINDFLAENADKIVVKDIKYTIQCENPHQEFDTGRKGWAVMVIYETK